MNPVRFFYQNENNKLAIIEFLMEKDMLPKLSVEITNGDCLLSGVVRDIYEICNKIQDPSKKFISIKRRGGNSIRFTGLTSPCPSTGVSKMVGCSFYLIIEESGTLAVKRDVAISGDDCILAELKSKDEFFVNKNLCTIITAHRIPLF
uniref:Uncharacterized protein n=1 Tax=Panagrolaimus davidi TaxID=227884 RepID=A0A914PEQ7_9BILA